MKKFISLTLALLICFSFCACGKNKNYEVAEKLDGTWTATWDSALGNMANIYEFEYSGQDAGSCEFYNVMNGDPFVHYAYGVFMVSDGKITMDFMAEIDRNGNINRFDKARQLTLEYTYEDGKLTVRDGDNVFYKTK